MIGIITRRIIPSRNFFTRVQSTTPKQDVAWNGSIFCAIGGKNNPGQFATSPDGIIWTDRDINVPFAGGGWPFSKVLWTGTRFFCVSGNNPNDYVIHSTDGVNWSSTSSGNSYPTLDAAWSGSMAVATRAIGIDLNRLTSSPDGVTWTNRTATANLNWHGVCWGGGGVNLFVAVAGAGGASSVMTSPDGITWTARTTPNIQCGKVAFGNGLFVAMPFSAGTAYMTSPDGINWTQRTMPWGSLIYMRIYWSALLNRFVAIGQGSPHTDWLITSPDGINWERDCTPWAQVTGIAENSSVMVVTALRDIHIFRP